MSEGCEGAAALELKLQPENRRGALSIEDEIVSLTAIRNQTPYGIVARIFTFGGIYDGGNRIDRIIRINRIGKTFWGVAGYIAIELGSGPKCRRRPTSQALRADSNVIDAAARGESSTQRGPDDRN